LQGASERAGHRIGADEAASGQLIAHTLRGDGFDASEDGTGRGTPIVVAGTIGAEMGRNRGLGSEQEIDLIVIDPNQVTSAGNRSNPQPGDPSHPLPADKPPLIAFSNTAGDTALGAGDDAPPITARKGDPGMIAFSSKDNGRDAVADLAPTLRRMGHDAADQNGGGQLAVAFQCHGTNVGEMGAVRSGNGGVTGGVPFVELGALAGVRRLTPVECERLMSFPDGYTDVIYRKKPAADGNRHRALGNSMVVNVVSWIGKRIELVERLAHGEAS